MWWYVCKFAYKDACHLFLGEERRECALCSWTCSSAAAEGADMGTSAVLRGASTLVKVEADLFSIAERDQVFGASQAGLCLLGSVAGSIAPLVLG